MCPVVTLDQVGFHFHRRRAAKAAQCQHHRRRLPTLKSIWILTVILMLPHGVTSDRENRGRWKWNFHLVWENIWPIKYSCYNQRDFREEILRSRHIILLCITKDICVAVENVLLSVFCLFLWITKLQLLHRGDREGISKASISSFFKYQWPESVVMLVGSGYWRSWECENFLMKLIR